VYKVGVEKRMCEYHITAIQWIRCDNIAKAGITYDGMSIIWNKSSEWRSSPASYRYSNVIELSLLFATSCMISSWFFSKFSAATVGLWRCRILILLALRLSNSENGCLFASNLRKDGLPNDECWDNTELELWLELEFESNADPGAARTAARTIIPLLLMLILFDIIWCLQCSCGLIIILWPLFWQALAGVLINQEQFQLQTTLRHESICFFTTFCHVFIVIYGTWIPKKLITKSQSNRPILTVQSIPLIKISGWKVCYLPQILMKLPAVACKMPIFKWRHG